MTKTELSGVETGRVLPLFTLVKDETPGRCELCGEACSVFQAYCTRCWAK